MAAVVEGAVNERPAVNIPAAPRRLHYPSFTPSGPLDGSAGKERPGRRSVSPPRSRAIQGVAGLGAESRRVLLRLTSASLRRLEEGFEASDPRRAGIVTHAHFRGVLESEGLNNPEVSDEIASAYALDNQQGSIWWAALLREIKVLRDPKAAHAQSRAAFGGVDSPTRGSATNASSSYEDDPEDPIAPRDARGNKVSDETARLIQELAKFFKSRRVHVADAFVNFEQPGQFCKTVTSVTRRQFEEVLHFITKGIDGLTDGHVLLLCEAFDDGTGLVKHKAFVQAVDSALDEVGTAPAGYIPHAYDSGKNNHIAMIRKCGSPKSPPPRGHSRNTLFVSTPDGERTGSYSLHPTPSTLDRSHLRSHAKTLPTSHKISPMPQAAATYTEAHAAQTTKLLGVQSMGPGLCQLPTRLEDYTRIKTEDTMAKIRQALQIYGIQLRDFLKRTDKHKEGAITCNNFRRQMAQLGVFRITPDEYRALENRYAANIGTFSTITEIRFNYTAFCQVRISAPPTIFLRSYTDHIHARTAVQDLQPTGPGLMDKIAALPYDLSLTSPLVVNDLSDEESQAYASSMDCIAKTIRLKGIDPQSFFSDFDRMSKTRVGGSVHNYTLHPGCISRSQFQQAMAKMQLSHLVGPEDLVILYKRYDRHGDFNHLAFVRDLAVIEKQQIAARAQAEEDRLRGVASASPTEQSPPAPPSHVSTSSSA